MRKEVIGRADIRDAHGPGGTPCGSPGGTEGTPCN